MKPRNCLIYYGWLNAFNSAQNGWDNEKVAQELARYGMLVLGDGIQDPEHGDFANSIIIITRLYELNPCITIFGYVSVNQSYQDFATKSDQWNDLEIDGIFMDEAGYDYGTSSTNGRVAFNAKVDFIHSQTDANCCLVNSWKPRYVLGTEDDTNNYPNSTWNPYLLQSNLCECDLCLMESFAITSAGSYESAAQWAARGLEWHAYQDEFEIGLVGSSVISDSDQDGQAKFDFVYTSACMWGLTAVSTSGAFYGALSAASKMWTRPDVEGFFGEPDCTISVENNGTKYFRYAEFGLFSIDFVNEISSRVKY